MATRKVRRPTPQREAQPEPLNVQAGASAPRTAREWIVYRAGVREGIERAHRDAHEKADAFLLRFNCNGVELSTPSAEAAVEAERSRVKTPAEFTPQLKRKGTA